MNKKIRFATIGTSKIAEKFLTAAKTCEEFEYVAAYSRELDRAKTFGAPYGAVKFFDDIDVMAADPDIDVVYIASPNAFHYQQAMIILQAGKHVLCEKAMASNMREVKCMYETAAEHNVYLLEAVRSSFDPGMDIVRQGLEKIGPVRRANIRFCQYSSRYDSFKEGKHHNIFDVNCSAGALMDIGVYSVHALVDLFGKPNAVHGASVMLPGEIDGAGTILASYDSMIAEVEYSKITTSVNATEFQGEKGELIIPHMENPSHVEVVYLDGTREVLREVPFENNMNYEVQEMIDIIKGRKTIDHWTQNSLLSMEIMDEIRKQCNIVFPADSAE